MPKFWLIFKEDIPLLAQKIADNLGAYGDENDALRQGVELVIKEYLRDYASTSIESSPRR